MDYMVMKLKSGSKTYALKIPKDDFVEIQKDPSLLAEYWDQVLADERENEKPQVGRPVKRRSKSVGAEAQGRKRMVPREAETIPNGTVHNERKKGGRKPKKSTTDLKSTVAKQVGLEPEKASTGEENVPEAASSVSLESPVKDKGKTSGLTKKSETKGILSDPQVIQVDAAPKRRGRKRKHIQVSQKELQETSKQLVEQDADSTTVSANISRDILPCSAHPKSGEKVEHDLFSSISPSANVKSRRSVRQQQRQQKQDDIKEFGEVSSQDQPKMPCGNSSQNISSVGSQQACGPQNIKSAKASSISQTLLTSESSVVAPKLTPHTAFPQVTSVQSHDFTPLCASTPYVTILPVPLPAPTTKVTQSSTPLSAVAQATVQQTFQQDMTQNLASASVNSLPLTSVIIPACPAAPQLAAPKVVSQSTSLIRVLSNTKQTVSSPSIPFSNNCQPVQCVQTSQNEAVMPAVPPTLNVTQKNVVEFPSAQSSPQVTPVKKAKMTLKEISAAIKKSPQQTAALLIPVKDKRLHNLEISPQKISPVKSLSIASSQDASQHTANSSGKQGSVTAVIATHPVRRRGRPPSLFKSFVNAQTKNIDPVYASKSSEVTLEVEQSDVAKHSSEVEAELKSPQSSKVKSNGGILGAESSSVTIQKAKLPPYDLSSVKASKEKPRLQLNQNILLLGETESVSLDNLKTSLGKKLPLKLLSKPETSDEKVKTSGGVVQKDVSVKDSTKDASVPDSISVFLVPVKIPPTSSCYPGSTSQNMTQVSGTQKLLCHTLRAKSNLLDAKCCDSGSESRKHHKISVTKGENDIPMEISHSAAVVVNSPTNTRYAAPSTKCMASNLSQTLDFKIVHPLTPVHPPISDVSKKVSVTAASSSGTSKDGSSVASPKKVPKTSTDIKEVQPKISTPQPKISQTPTVGAVCGTLLASPCHVPNVSSSSQLQPINALPSKLSSHGVPSIPVVVSEVTPGAGKTSKSNELQYSTSPPSLKAFETLLNEGLDGITQLLAEKALACKGSWDTGVCLYFLSECLKEKDTFFNPSAKDLNFETVCCAVNKTYPKLNTTVSDCNERWWEFVTLYEILAKKLECHQLNECLLIPEERRKGITIICQSMAHRKYPLSHKNLQKGNRNDRVNAALKFLNDSLENEMDKVSACNVNGTTAASPPGSVNQTSDVGKLWFVDLFMLLVIKMQQCTQSAEFFVDYIEETLTALAEGHGAS